MIITPKGFQNNLHQWISNYSQFTRPRDQLKDDLKPAWEEYTAVRTSTGSAASQTPELHPRSLHQNIVEGCGLPWVNSSNQSVRHPNLHFIGLDNRKPSLTLGIFVFVSTSLTFI